jgi:hypothetical protein
MKNSTYNPPKTHASYLKIGKVETFVSVGLALIICRI